MSPAQPSPAVPSRPRLADHVAARRHVVDGVEWIVLHDTLQERTARIGAREWALLRSADGTRDLDGILAAAAAQDRHARLENLRSFLGELQAAGMLASGPAAVTASSRAGRAGDGTPGIEEISPNHRSDAPLDPLPGYRLDCDGAGSCCRIYPTTMFAPHESVRARALCPEVVDEGWDEERVFTPERGGSFWDGPGRPGARSVLMVDGGCGYLTTESRCALHQVAGAAGKPLGCQLYPAVFVDDGEAIRVSVAPECACVFRSLGREGGAEIAPPGAQRGVDLDARVFVRVLPQRVALSSEREVERGRYVRWARQFAEHWRQRIPSQRAAVADERADESGSDPARALWSTAAAIEVEGLEWGATLGALHDPLPWPDEELSRWGAALEQRLRRRSEEDVLWRGEQDWARAASGWVLAAVERLLSAHPSWPAFACDPAEQQVELFYLWALAHGHGMVQALPLSAALRDHALRLLVARAVGELDESLAPAAIIGSSARSVPLALVEALLRGHGLQAYASSLGWGLDPAALAP